MGFRSIERHPDDGSVGPQVPWGAALAVLAVAIGLVAGVFGFAVGLPWLGGMPDRPPENEALQVQRRIYPEYPAGGHLYGDQRCLADVTIGAHGVPSAVRVSDCPEVFVGPTRDAVLQWRWVPLVNAGEANTTIAVAYKVR